MRTNSDAEMIRAATATEEFREAYCADWPAAYSAMLPVTSEGKTLVGAFVQIRKLMASDFAMMQAEQERGQRQTGPEPLMVKWTPKSLRIIRAICG